MKMVFTNINVFDGIGDELAEGRNVIIENGRIRSVDGDFDKSALGEFDVVYDGTGMTMLPGLIDCHANIIGLTTEEQKLGITDRTIAASTMRGIAGGKNCIEAGVTTIRVDTTGHHGIYALRDAFDSGEFTGPHMVVPGRAICTTCGHGWNFGNHVADGPYEVRKAVREEIRDGADWVKLMITGGAGTRTERMEDQQMSDEELAAGIEEAHARGKKCFAHLTVDRAIRAAVDAGLDSVEHGILMEEGTAKKLAEKGVFYVPTLGVYRRLVRCGEAGTVPDYMYRKSLAIVERHAKSFQYAVQNRVNIAAGTDSGQVWFPLGESLLYELEIMSQEGLSNAQTLKTATSNAAKLLDNEQIGSIEAGKNADILIVAGNPLRQMQDIRKTACVLKDGRLVVNHLEV